jgi:hypothetical protein
MHPCLYCRRVDIPRTREHVLQSAFGAVATLPTEVCGECNAAFSPLDKVFVEAVQFYYTGENMLRALRLGRTVLKDGTDVNARYRRDGYGEFAPQIFEVSPTEWRFLGHRECDFHVMLRELADPEQLKIKLEQLNSAPGVPRLAIIRSAPYVYLIQGIDDELLARFSEKVRTTGFKPDWVNDTFRNSAEENPSIRFDTSLALEPFCRSMAKIALNFICYRLGSDIALREEFDSVRRYARFGEGSFVDYAVPTILNHSLADSNAAFVAAEHHALFLVVGGGKDVRTEAVFISVRGKTIGRLDLTRGRPGLPPGAWLLTRFDEKHRSVEDLTLPDDMPRALLNPEVLGIEKIWPFRPPKY